MALSITRFYLFLFFCEVPAAAAKNKTEHFILTTANKFSRNCCPLSLTCRVNKMRIQVTIEQVQQGVLFPLRSPGLHSVLLRRSCCQSDCKKCKPNEPKHNASSDGPRHSVRSGMRNQIQIQVQVPVRMEVHVEVQIQMGVLL